MSFTGMRIPDWILSSKGLTFGAKMLLARMIVLSIDGEQSVFVRRKDFAKAFGVSDRAITRYFAELETAGLIASDLNPDKWSQIRYFTITDRALSENEPSPNCLPSRQNVQSIPLDNMSTPSRQNVHTPLTNCPAPLDNLAICSLDQNIKENRSKNKSENTNGDTRTPTVSNDPYSDQSNDPHSDHSSFTKEVDLKEVENRSREANADSEPSPPKKSQPKHVDYPQTVEAVKEMVVHYRDTHPKVEDIENLDVDYYAQAIFDYYVAPFNDGKWRDKHNTLIKVPSRAVGGWINRDVEKKSLKVKDPYEGMTYDDLMASLDTVSPAEKERRAREGMVDADFEVVTDEPFPQIPGRFSL